MATFDREAAKKYYTDEEIDEFLRQGEGQIPQKAGGIGGFLGDILQPAKRFGQMVGAAAIQAPHIAVTGRNLPERLRFLGMPEQELQRFAKPETAAVEAGKRTAGALSFLFPAGKAGILARGARGAAAGGLYGVSAPEATTESVIGGAALGGVAAPVLGNILPSILKTVKNPQSLIHPLRTAGKQIEEIATTGGGNVANEILEKKFGTSMNVVPEMLKGIGAGAQKSRVAQIVSREIATQGRSPGGVVPQMTYADILDLRKGAWDLVYDEQVPKFERKVYSRIAQKYSEILHEGIPAMIEADKAFGRIARSSDLVKAVGKRAGYAGAAYLAWSALQSLKEMAKGS